MKANFQYLICTIAADKPKFLTDLIYQGNPEITSEAPISFSFLELFHKNLIHKFTTILFTKLNYKKIFASAISILPCLKGRVNIDYFYIDTSAKKILRKNKTDATYKTFSK